MFCNFNYFIHTRVARNNMQFDYYFTIVNRDRLFVNVYYHFFRNDDIHVNENFNRQIVDQMNFANEMFFNRYVNNDYSRYIKIH